MKASDHACRRCGDRATDSHHRLPRSRGGPDDTLNLVALCHCCHMAVHANPALARAEGWTVAGYVVRGVYRGADEAYRLQYPERAA